MNHFREIHWFLDDESIGFIDKWQFFYIKNIFLCSNLQKYFHHKSSEHIFVSLWLLRFNPLQLFLIFFNLLIKSLLKMIFSLYKILANMVSPAYSTDNWLVFQRKLQYYFALIWRFALRLKILDKYFDRKRIFNCWY